jgi:signal transduction histidine kinase
MISREFESDLAAIQNIDSIPHILDVVCSVTGMGFAAVARVTRERWVALAVRDQIKFGLTPGGELKVATTICSEIRDAGTAVVIDEVAKDEIYCSHPTPKLYGFQSYISVPIMLRNGRFYGTLCAIDPKPHRLNTPEMLAMFKLFAELIALQLDSQDQIAATRAELASSEADLLDVRNTAQLREEFIAVLGHDLRNPIASVDAGVFLLLKQESDAAKRKILQLMRGSVVRMIGLVENLMDFARGRLGDGIFLDKKNAAPLAPVLEQIVSELRGVYPDRSLQTHIALNAPIDCDPRRVGQLLSNLLGNALTHGSAEKPVVVRASTAGGTFELSVSNAGSPIPADVVGNLFQPFYRGAARPSQQGLGLGLYIASQIAQAHGGTLTVASTPEETRFTFRMPLGA